MAAVARNAAIDMARHRATRPVTPIADIAAAGPAWRLTDRAGGRRPWPCGSALARLTPDQRELVRLAYFEHLTQQEIATRLGLPLGTVKSRTFEALRVLRRALAGE